MYSIKTFLVKIKTPSQTIFQTICMLSRILKIVRVLKKDKTSFKSMKRMTYFQFMLIWMIHRLIRIVPSQEASSPNTSMSKSLLPKFQSIQDLKNTIKGQWTVTNHQKNKIVIRLAMIKKLMASWERKKCTEHITK